MTRFHFIDRCANGLERKNTSPLQCSLKEGLIQQLLSRVERYFREFDRDSKMSDVDGLLYRARNAIARARDLTAEYEYSGRLQVCVGPPSLSLPPAEGRRILVHKPFLLRVSDLQRAEFGAE